MAMENKEGPDLSVGSTFLVEMAGAGLGFPVRIKVLSREGEKVSVEMSVPLRPKVCDQCGRSGGLSVDVITGEVVCMTTGCGKDFGYNPLTVLKTVKVSDFKPTY